jgi:hypothetical protein
MSVSTETNPAFKLSKESRISMPLALLVGLLAVAGAGAVAWSETRADVISTKADVVRSAADIIELRTEAKATREILIRIDENVKDLRRSERRGNQP